MKMAYIYYSVIR